MGFFREESWSGLPFRSPGDFSNSGIELASLASPTWQADFFFFFTADQEGSPLPSGGGSFHTDVGVQELEWQLARPLEPTLRTRFLFLPPNFTARSKSHSVVVCVCHSYPEILTFKVMVIGAGAFRRCPGHEGGAPVSAQRESCCHIRFQRKYAIHNAGRQPPLDSKLACALTIDFQDSRDGRNKFMLSINHLVYSQSVQSVQSLSHVRLFTTHESQHTRPPCPSPTPGVHSDSRPSSQ